MQQVWAWMPLGRCWQWRQPNHVVLCDATPRCCCCCQVGFESFGTDLPEDVSQADLLKVVADYNADPKVS